MPKRRWSFFLPAQDHFFIKRLLIHINVCFPDSGKILLSTLLIGASIAAPGLHLIAYLLPCFIFTLFVTAVGFSIFFRPRVSVLRQLSSTPAVGEYLIYRIIVTNIGKRPIKNLTVLEGILPFGLYNVFDHAKIDNTIGCLLPKESTSLRLVIHCKFRGVYQLSTIWVASSFPSGLFRWPVRLKKTDKLTVYPNFISQTEFKIPFHQIYQPGGIAVSSHIGASNEFLNTREYRHGDRLKDIHWVSSARSGKLIVKEYVDEYFVRIGLFLDTAFSKGEEPHSFEKRISMAAGIADAIARKEYIIDLFAAGEDLYHFQIGRAMAHLENLLELLSCLEDTKKVDIKRLQNNLMRHTREISAMVMIFHDWDQARSQLCRSLEHLGISLRVIVVRDKSLTLAPDRKLVIISAKKRGMEKIE